MTAPLDLEALRAHVRDWSDGRVILWGNSQYPVLNRGQLLALVAEAEQAQRYREATGLVLAGAFDDEEIASPFVSVLRSSLNALRRAALAAPEARQEGEG